MAADDFFARWSRRRAEAAERKVTAEPEPSVADTGAPPAPELPPPTMEEVARLTHESDYARFVAPGVDESVRLSAMKKLFSNPRFKVMDGLDTYIEDYNSFEPISPQMLASLNHARALLDPLAQLEKPLMRPLDEVAEPTDVPLAIPAGVAGSRHPAEATPAGDQADPGSGEAHHSQTPPDAPDVSDAGGEAAIRDSDDLA